VNVRRLLLLTSVVLSISVAASAQSTSPAPVSSQTPSTSASSLDEWTGFYAGGNLGVASQAFSGQVSFLTAIGPGSSVAPLDLGALSASGGTIGVQAGYGLKLTRTLIGGLEVQMTRTSPLAVGPSGSATAPADQVTVQGGLATSIRARAGTTVMRGLFLYGTIGAAITRVTAAGALSGTNASLVPNSSATQTMKGATFGVGGEYAPWRQGTLEHVTIGAEFRHASLGTQTFTFAPTGASLPEILQPITGTIASHTNEFDVRVNYRFSLRKR
jgi:outer membrane immunogenic protein